MSSYAWVLNFDADLELADRGPYTPTDAVRRAMAAQTSRVALLGPDDVLIDDPRAKGRVGRAFCPTRRAIAMMERAGVTPEPHPSHDILRHVNSRRFCAELGQTLPGAVFVDTAEAALEVLASPPPIGIGWRVKRAFGMSGRGQRVVTELDAATHAFLRDLNGFQIEPNVAIERELSVHGWIGQTYPLRIVEQRCDARGQWLESVEAEVSAPALLEEAERTASALEWAGYFGPFGIDAFFYEGGKLQPRSEINARFTMGFRV